MEKSNEQVIGIFRQNHVPVFPGANTATEMYKAGAAGLRSLRFISGIAGS